MQNCERFIGHSAIAVDVSYVRVHLPQVRCALVLYMQNCERFIAHSAIAVDVSYVRVHLPEGDLPQSPRDTTEGCP
jgi:uncharacterized protein YijF (DUF1287 family)